MEKLKTIIFDCDGVVINSSADIAKAVNMALNHFNMAALPEKDLVSYTGDGAQALIERAVTASLKLKNTPMITTDTYTSILTWYLDYYYNHSIERTVLYTGIADLLETISLHGIHIGLVSNKPENISTRILKYFDIADFFDVIIGPNQIKHLKPAPDGIILAMKNINKTADPQIKPEQVLMVGDSQVDIQAGHAFGCNTCAITGGFGNTEKLLAENPDLTLQLAGELIHHAELWK